MTVGLAGKACAGKDFLVPWFLERGFTVIDADAIGHRALEVKRDAIESRFGTIDRTGLGKIVFSDPRALADLEAITHPWIAAEIRVQLESSRSPTLINAALLHKADLWKLCDLVVWVQAPWWQRILRARTRDGWSWSRILKRMRAQWKLRPQVFGKGVDILRVDNRGRLREVHEALEARFGRLGTFPVQEDTHEE